MNDKTAQKAPSRLVRVVLIIILIIVLIFPVGTVLNIIIGNGVYKFVQKQLRTSELKKLPGYYVCTDHYEYYMLNTTKSDDTLLLLKNVCDADFISELKQNSYYLTLKGHDNPVIQLRVVFPTKDLKYGYETTWLELVYADWLPPWTPDYENLLITGTRYFIYVEETDTCWEDLYIRERKEEGGFVTIQEGS